MQPGRAWMVSSFSLAVSYAIASLIPMNQWIGFWLRGSFYAAYQLFLSGRSCHLALCWQCSIIKDRSRFSQWPCGGAVLGYVAGLVALLLQPLAQPDGLHLFVESLRISAPEAVIAILWFPMALWRGEGVVYYALLTNDCSISQKEGAP